MEICGREFPAVLLVDAEFGQAEGEQPEPRCLVVKDLATGEIERVWVERRGQPPPPILCRPGALLVSYLASAEVACLLRLGWPVPDWTLDLFAEFRAITNGRHNGGASLAAAVSYFGGDVVDVVHKEAMRDLALRGGDYTGEERCQLLSYCEADVVALELVFRAMLPGLVDDLPLLRGRYMRAVASVELAGIPIDTEALSSLQTAWPQLRKRITAEAAVQYPGVFCDGSLSIKGLDRYLASQGIVWPRTEMGRPKTDQDTFKDWASVYPQLKPLKDVLYLAGQLKLNRLAVGGDGRNRYLTGVFGSTSSRNQPSATRNIFGLPSFMRGLVQPLPGFALAYLDYEQQEFGIAAALSGDRGMQKAYRSGDPYLTFAVQAGAAPEDATKVSHREIRELYKTTALAVMFGMGEKTLALRIGRSEAAARELLRLHRSTYGGFWRWIDRTVDKACLDRYISTVLGWRLHLTGQTKDRTVANFPMQATGADMLRLAVCLAQDNGVMVIAMVHDAILIEAPVEEIDEVVARAKAAMSRASEVILAGFTLRTEEWVVRYPDRMLSSSGVPMWNRLWQLARDINGAIPSGIIP